MATVLVVDDSECDRRYLVTLLKHAGHHVMEAEDGLDAGDRMSTTTPDLVITGIFMPRMDGFEFIRRMRERTETQKTPVIFYTAPNDEAAARALAEQCTAAKILPKASEPELVVRTVDNILGEPISLPLGDEFRSPPLEQATTKLRRRMAELEGANAELAQKASELRLVTDAVPVLISFIDADQRFQFANRAHQHWFGQSPEELRSKHLAEIWGKRAYYKLGDYCERALTGSTVRFETLLSLKDGAEKCIRATYTPEFDSNGSVRGFVALVEDVSEIKAVESTLREGKSRLELALAAGSIGTWDYYPAARELSCDLRCKTAFGLPQDASADYDTFLAGVHPEDRERVDKAMQGAVDPAGTGQYDEEYRTVGLKDSVVRCVHAQGQAFFWAIRNERKAAALIGTVQDITSRKRAEEALRQANDNLQQFAYAAAHEVQEPLRNIVNSLALLDRVWQGQPDDEATQLVGESTENAQRLLQMVKDLLAYTQITGSPEQRSELVDASEVLKQALKNLNLSIAESQARITSSRLPRVRMASTHLLQLFQNLIGNALKYRKREQRQAIDVSAVRRGAEWLFTVADNGIGFDQAYAERIFGIFKRLHKKHEYAGTGIGLALCSRIVSGYGGRIWAEGQLGVGATFRFTLPVQELPAQEREGDEQLVAQCTKVLIVEDNPLDARLVSYALNEEKKWATETVVIEDGEKAIQYLIEQSAKGTASRPDLILLDINMPKRDGTEVLNVIRATESLRDLPVFVLSSSTEEETRRRVSAANLAANQYLTKPPDLEGFLALGSTLRRLYHEATCRS